MTWILALTRSEGARGYAMYVEVSTDGVYGVGYLEGHAAFVRSSWLRDHGEPSAQWRAKLDGMLAYAATRGWLRDGHVQAHVERGGQ
jgi:hypothetical protein